MSYPPYCMHTHTDINKDFTNLKNEKTSLIWCGDYDASDLNIDLEGVVGIYSCSNNDCELIYEIMDLFIDDEREQRIIKYYFNPIDEGLEEKLNHDAMISSCLYCSSKLDIKSKRPTDEAYGSEFESDGITTTLECTCCKTIYDVVDSYPTDDLYNDIELDIRDKRTIFIR